MVRSWIHRFYERPEFSRLQPAVDAGHVIRWWEERRLFYNVAVGCTGLTTCFLLVICAMISDSMVGEPIGMPDGPLLGVFAIIFYAILANICYTGGWVTELLVRVTGRADDAAKVSIKAFHLGVTFSILLTLSPAVLCWFAFAVALFKGQKLGPLGE
jgi:hypothetical protein